MSWLPPLSSLAFVAAGALLLVAWAAVILAARRRARSPHPEDRSHLQNPEAAASAAPRWTVLAATLAPPLLVTLVVLAAVPRFAELRVALEGLSFEVGPRAVEEVRVGGSPEDDHLVVRDLPPGFLTFRATREGHLVADLHPQARAGSASAAGDEPDRAFALATVGDGEPANTFELGDGDRLRLAGGGELVFDAGRPALGPAGEGYPELTRRRGRAGLPIVRQLPAEAEILPVRYFGAKGDGGADGGDDEEGDDGGADGTDSGTSVLVGVGGTPLGAFLYRGGGYLRSDWRIGLPGPEVEVARDAAGEVDDSVLDAGDGVSAADEPRVAAFDPRLAVLEPGQSRRFALHRVDYAPPPREEGDPRSRVQERRSFEARWDGERLELVLDTPSHVQLGRATLAAAAEGGDGPPLLALVGRPDAAAAMDDDPSLLHFSVLGGPLAAELFSRIRVDGSPGIGGQVRATTHTGARRYRLGEAFRVGDRSAAVVRVTRLGVPWGTLLLVWATAVAALLAGWTLRHRPLPLLVLTGVELFLATRLLIAYQGAYLDPGAAEAAWISVAAWAWVPWVLQAFVALHRSWRAARSAPVLAHLAVAATAAGVALGVAGSEPWKIVATVLLPPLVTAGAVFAVRWFEGRGERPAVLDLWPEDRRGRAQWGAAAVGLAALTGLVLWIAGVTDGAEAALAAVALLFALLLIFSFLAAWGLLDRLPGWRSLQRPAAAPAAADKSAETRSGAVVPAEGTDEPGTSVGPFSTRRWMIWTLGLTAGLAAFRLLTLFGAGWKERIDLGAAALAVSIYYTPAALFVLALAWAGRRRRWGFLVALGSLAVLFAVPAAARDWGAFLIFVLPPALLFALAVLEPRRRRGGDRSAPAPSPAPPWQRAFFVAPLVAVLLLHGLGVFVLPRVFGAGPSTADLDAARSSPEAAMRLLEAGVDAEANSLRLWSWAAPEALQRVGTSSSEGLQVVMATLESYAGQGPWGRGLLGVPLASSLDATHLDDNLSAVHVLGTFGWLGALVLLAALAVWALAPLLLPRPSGTAAALARNSVPWSPRGAFGLMLLWTFTCAGLYMFAANVGLMLFTGKNVYFLAAASLSDVVEGTLLAALALWALCAEEVAP